ncbi:MAG: energy transducer TonB [Algibacter sp.]
MMHYIIQTIAFQVFFLLVYDVFLKKETFFNWNRIYLLGTAVLSLILPFIKIDRFKEVISPNYIISLPEISIGQSSANSSTAIVLDAVILKNDSLSFLGILFYTGVFVAFCLFLIKVIKISVMVIKNPKQSIGKIVLVELLNSTAAFSFFHYIFLGEHIKTEDKDAILKHELIHSEQKHTIDLLFFEMLRIVFWFNPLVYMYQNRLATLHEFVADANAVKHQDKEQYYQNLLAQVFETKNISFINTFFNQSLIKKRIVMLSKTKSKQVKLFKYALLIPMVLGMLVYTSCGNQKNVAAKEKASLTEQINQLNDVVESKEITLEEEKQAMINLSKTLNKTTYKNASDVPFSEVDEVPIFPGCEDLSSSEQKKCLSNNISQHVNRNFKTNIASTLGLKGKQRINVIFKIDKEGRIIDVRSRAPHPDLEAEAVRVINTLPIMIPGKEAGKNVNVPYSLPIIFQVQDDVKNNEQKLIPLDEVEVPFSVIENVPVYPGCEALTSNEEKKKCMSEKMSKFINRNFNTEIANKNGLSGRQRINVIFKIDTEGNIIDIRSRAPHPELEKEAIRVITLLPKMKPGVQRGKTVTVPYSLPIIFEVKNNNQMLDEVIIDVPFSVVEEVPIFPGCDSLQNREEKMNCTSNGINVHVNKYFDTKLAKKLGLSGKQRINVIFKIDKEGRIIDVRSRASHPDLEAEAIRVINTLPIMIPGKQRGKNVSVPYSLPITFQVAD